jgi:hypothetical protein
MKYILIALLLTSAVYAAPLAQVQTGNINGQLPPVQAGNAIGQATQLQGGNTNGQLPPVQGGNTQLQGGNAISQATQQQGQQQQRPAQQQQGTQGTQGVQGINQPAIAPSTGTGAGIANGQTPSPADLATAVSNWMADTAMVSNFLNTGPSIQNNVQFKQAATVAFNAEVDELNHKAIIDAANGNDPNVIAANSTLATGGSFQDVVDKLQQMSVQGMAAAANINLINQNRCVNGMLGASK